MCILVTRNSRGCDDRPRERRVDIKKTKKTAEVHPPAVYMWDAALNTDAQAGHCTGSARGSLKTESMRQDTIAPDEICCATAAAPPE